MKLLVGTEWKNSPSLNLIKIGWLLLILVAIGSTSISITHDFTTEENDNYLIYNILGEKDPMLKFLNVVFEVILIISLIFYVIMIRKISIRQELKSGTSI